MISQVIRLLCDSRCEIQQESPFLKGRWTPQFDPLLFGSRLSITRESNKQTACQTGTKQDADFRKTSMTKLLQITRLSEGKSARDVGHAKIAQLLPVILQDLPPPMGLHAGVPV